MPNVIDVYVSSQILVHMKAPGELDQKKVTKLLGGVDIKVKSCKKDDRQLM